MKNKDIQKVVLLKYENGDRPSKIVRDIAGTVSLRTIWRWIKMIKDNRAIDLSAPPGRTRTVRTKGNIKQVKYRTNRKKRNSQEKLEKIWLYRNRLFEEYYTKILDCFPTKSLKSQPSMIFKKRSESNLQTG